jgi:drug/metabolite transporter (DMT)-like permease
MALTNVLLFTLFWSLQIFVSKLGFLHGAQLIPYSLQSSIIILILVVGYIISFKLKEFRKVSKDTGIKLYWASAIHAGVGGLLSFAAVLYTTAINAAFIFQFTTVTTPLFAWLLIKEKMTRSKIITMILVMIGMLLFITKGKLITPHLGDILALSACVAWSAGNVLIRGILKKHPVDADVSTFYRGIGGLSFLILFIILSPLYPSSLQTIFHGNYLDLHGFLYVFLNALCIVLLWIFLNRSLKIASASYMTLLSALSPLVVAILSFTFLHETVSTIQFFGAGFIIFGGLITHYLKMDEH